jgi:DNA invertase Pin-like site-specific DNA recombinase
MGHSKETIDVVRAAMALAERDVELGLASVEEIRNIPRTRFAPAERKEAVALLKAEGKSNRKIAKELNVGGRTVARDLGQPTKRSKGAANAAPSAKNSAPNGGKFAHGQPPPPDFELSEFESEIDKEHLKTGFIIRADQASRFAVYSGPVDEEVRRVAWRAEMAWHELVQKLDGGNDG